MVSPAKPNSTSQIVKTPKEPKAPKQAGIPAELARQNIPTTVPTKKLAESTITPKDDPTPQDSNVTKKAQEVLGIEDRTTPEAEDGLDFFDSLMAEETTTSEATQTTETPGEPEGDGLDFFDSLMEEGTNDSEVATQKSVTQAEDQSHISFIKDPAKITSFPNIVMNDSEINNILKNAILKLSGFENVNRTENEILREIEQASIVYDSKSNLLLTHLKLGEESNKQIEKFLQKLNLTPEKLANLKIVSLTDKQWNLVTAKFILQIKQIQTTYRFNGFKDDNNKSSINAEEEGNAKLTRRQDKTATKNPTKHSENQNVLEEDIKNELIQEEVLVKERAKLRDKKAAETEHKNVEKEIQTWERKQTEIKRDIGVRNTKRRTP